MKKLKKSYHKAFFTLIKAYKRYYLGTQLLKIPFYKLISKQTKLAKWQEKREQRREFLREALNGFKSAKHLYKTFHKESEKWLNSQEFKEKYLYTNHPFPPLLNPALLNDKNSLLNYNDIPAELAWELNLPLPDNYKFIFLSTHGCGRCATGSFLRLCGVYYDNLKQFLSNKQRYISYYNELLNPIFPHHIVHISEHRDDEQRKFIALLKKKPFLILLRDPISNLKTHYNYPYALWWDKPEIKKDFFTLNDKDFMYFGKYVLHRDFLDDKYFFASLHQVFEPFSSETLVYDLIQDEAVVLQLDEVKPDYAFDTFKKLAKKFDFNPPKESDKAIFEVRMVQGMLDVCYTVLKIYDSDFILSEFARTFDIHITTSIIWNLSRNDKELFCDMSEFLGFKDNALSADLVIMVEKPHFKALQKDEKLVEKIKNYLKEFIKSLAEQNEAYKKLAFSEGDILNFLKNSQIHRRQVKEHLQDRVAWFKANRPDIVESWKFYNEFEKMCAELDSAETDSRESAESVEYREFVESKS